MFKFAAVSDAPVRLILSCVYTQLVWGKRGRQVEEQEMRLGQMGWKHVGKLDQMPSWAVDKHTFRGKYVC